MHHILFYFNSILTLSCTEEKISVKDLQAFRIPETKSVILAINFLQLLNIKIGLRSTTPTIFLHSYSYMHRRGLQNPSIKPIKLNTIAYRLVFFSFITIFNTYQSSYFLIWKMWAIFLFSYLRQFKTQLCQTTSGRDIIRHADIWGDKQLISSQNYYPGFHYNGHNI